MNGHLRRTRALLAAGMAASLAVGILSAGQAVLAAGTTTVGLGTAAPFAILAGTPAITNSGSSTINGDVGIAPAADVTGFPPGKINGTTHANDAVAIQAQSDLAAAYKDAAGRVVTTTHGTLGGLTLVSGVYNAGGVTLGLTGTLTLDAKNDANAVWIFQATSDLVTASSSVVRIINGGKPCNVFWQVTSSATLGSGSTFVGTIMALTSITMASGVTVEGRALARNGEVTLINDSITQSTCAAVTPSASPATATASPARATASPARAKASPAANRGGGTPIMTQAPTDTVVAADAHGPGVLPMVLLVVGLLGAAMLIMRRRPALPTRRR